MKRITEFLAKNIKDLCVVGCDGTAVNTDWFSGVVEYGKVFSKSIFFQCMVCLLKKNELSLRHLFRNYGTTTGPCPYLGEIGKQLKSLEIWLLLVLRQLSAV